MDSVNNTNEAENNLTEMANSSEISASEIVENSENTTENVVESTVENVTEDVTENVAQSVTENANEIVATENEQKEECSKEKYCCSHKKKKKKFFDTFDAGLACITFVCLQFAFVFCFMLLPKEMKTQPVVYIASFFLEAMFGLASVIVAKARRVDILEATGMNKKISPKIIWQGFLIAAGSLCFFFMLTITFSDFLYNIGYTSSGSSVNIENFGTYIIFVIVSCITPAFFEDLLFRGVITSGLRKHKESVAIVVSSIIFMLMHGNADQTVHQIVVGMILAYLFIKSGNLWLGVIVHFFNNFITVTLTFILNLVVKTEEVVDTDAVLAPATDVNWFTWVVELVIAIMIASVGYFIIMRIANKMIKESDKVNGKVSDNQVVAMNVNANVVNAEVSGTSDSQKAAQNLFVINFSDEIGEISSFEDDGSSEDELSHKKFSDIAELKVNDDVTAKVEIQESTESLKEEVVETSKLSEQEQNASEESELTQNANETVNKPTMKELEPTKSIATTLFFAFSIGYLVIEWLLSLFGGF